MAVFDIFSFWQIQNNVKFKFKMSEIEQVKEKSENEKMLEIQKLLNQAEPEVVERAFL